MFMVCGGYDFSYLPTALSTIRGPCAFLLLFYFYLPLALHKTNAHSNRHKDDGGDGATVLLNNTLSLQKSKNDWFYLACLAEKKPRQRSRPARPGQDQNQSSLDS